MQIMERKMKIPPLALLFVCAFLAILLKAYIPFYTIEFPFPLVVVFVLIGVMFLVLPVVRFVKNQTTVDPRKPELASKLVTTGLYQISRNPMYVGMLFVLTSFAIWLGAISSLLSVLVFFLLIDRYQIKNEELALENNFGQEFRNYTKQVPRWLIFKP